MSNRIALELTGDVPSKKNRYKTGGGKFYLDSDVKAWQDDAAWQLKAQTLKLKNFEPITFPIRLELDFFITRDRDLDNLQNSILDLLQYARVIVNDRQIVSITATKAVFKTAGCFIRLFPSLSTDTLLREPEQPSIVKPLASRKNICMQLKITSLVSNEDGSLTVTDDTGAVDTFTNTAPVVAPEDTEVDIKRTDGTIQKFVPAPADTSNASTPAT